MTVTLITSANFNQWLANNPHRHSVLMVKQLECIPCGRVTPMYNSLVNKYGDVAQFGVHTIEPSDYPFAKHTLAITSTPTFIVYNSDHEIEYRLSSAKRFTDLKRFMETLYPTI